MKAQYINSAIMEHNIELTLLSENLNHLFCPRTKGRAFDDRRLANKGRDLAGRRLDGFDIHYTTVGMY